MQALGHAGEVVGERGREVQEFLSQNLGEEGLRRAVVVVSTSDESPLRRLMAPKTATSIAEYYRDRGLNVLLLVDSLTRCARAIREVELSAGEIPVRQGYTSGVYVQLPRLLERAGNNEYGSITALYTNLTSGTEEFDPLADELKSILDGHIVLDPHLAREGIRPAIDPLSSVSRLFERLCQEEDRRAAADIVRILSRLRRDRDILLLGGSPDSELRAALAVETEVRSLLSQGPNEVCDYDQARANLHSTSERFRALLARETVSIETSAT